MRASTVGVIVLAAAAAVAAGAFLPWAAGADAAELSLAALVAGGEQAPRAGLAGSVAAPLLAIAALLAAAAVRESRLLTGVAALALIGLLTIWLVTRLATGAAGEPTFATGPLVEIGALAALMVAAAAPERAGRAVRTGRLRADPRVGRLSAR